jgi:hypothetical protein
MLTTITYDSTSQLPLLHTTPGISSFERYRCNLCQDTRSSHTSSELINLTKQQCLKLYLHESCAHEGFQNLNKWIREGRFPNVSPALAKEPDPPCTICNFGKARCRSHKSHVGHISANHHRPGDGVSSDGMEAGTPGRIFTTKGSPTTKRYKFGWIISPALYIVLSMNLNMQRNSWPPRQNSNNGPQGLILKYRTLEPITESTQLSYLGTLVRRSSKI